MERLALTTSPALPCHYERIYQRDDDLGGRRRSDLTADDLTRHLTHFKASAYGMYRDEGMCDPGCKMLLG